MAPAVSTRTSFGTHSKAMGGSAWQRAEGVERISPGRSARQSHLPAARASPAEPWACAAGPHTVALPLAGRMANRRSRQSLLSFEARPAFAAAPAAPKRQQASSGEPLAKTPATPPASGPLQRLGPANVLPNRSARATATRARRAGARRSASGLAWPCSRVPAASAPRWLPAAQKRELPLATAPGAFRLSPVAAVRQKGMLRPCAPRPGSRGPSASRPARVWKSLPNRIPSRLAPSLLSSPPWPRTGRLVVCRSSHTRHPHQCGRCCAGQRLPRRAALHPGCLRRPRSRPGPASTPGAMVCRPAPRIRRQGPDRPVPPGSDTAVSPGRRLRVGQACNLDRSPPGRGRAHRGDRCFGKALRDADPVGQRGSSAGRVASANQRQRSRPHQPSSRRCGNRRRWPSRCPVRARRIVCPALRLCPVPFCGEE